MDGSLAYNRCNTIFDLLSKGADPNMEPEGKDSVLMSAVRCKDKDAVTTLIAGGAKVNHIGCNGNMAIHLCCNLGIYYLLTLQKILLCL